jgi:hypothetical protein
MAAMVEVEVVGRRRSVRMPAVAEVEGYRLILDGDTHQVSVQTKKSGGDERCQIARKRLRI